MRDSATVAFSFIVAFLLVHLHACLFQVEVKIRHDFLKPKRTPSIFFGWVGGCLDA